MYVVANVQKETIIIVTPNRGTAYRAAMVEQEVYGARKKDVSITPMAIDVQFSNGTEMCYDDRSLYYALRDIEERDKDEDDEDEDYDEDEDDYDEDEDEDYDEEDEDEDEAYVGYMESYLHLSNW